MIPFLMAAVLPAAGLAQSQSGGGSGVPQHRYTENYRSHRHRDSPAGRNPPTSHGGYTGRD